MKPVHVKISFFDVAVGKSTTGNFCLAKIGFFQITSTKNRILKNGIAENLPFLNYTSQIRFPLNVASPKLQDLKSRFFLSLLLPPLSFWKMQFSATASAKLQFCIEALPKSKEFSLVPGNWHPKNPTESRTLSEKSQFLKVQP